MCVTHIANRHLGWRMQPEEGSLMQPGYIYCNSMCVHFIPFIALKVDRRAHSILKLKLFFYFFITTHLLVVFLNELIQCLTCKTLNKYF